MAFPPSASPSPLPLLPSFSRSPRLLSHLAYLSSVSPFNFENVVQQNQISLVFLICELLLQQITEAVNVAAFLANLFVIREQSEPEVKKKRRESTEKKQQRKKERT